jgi:hypothetical protein
MIDDSLRVHIRRILSGISRDLNRLESVELGKNAQDEEFHLTIWVVRSQLVSRRRLCYKNFNKLVNTFSQQLPNY